MVFYNVWRPYDRLMLGRDSSVSIKDNNMQMTIQHSPFYVKDHTVLTYETQHEARFYMMLHLQLYELKDKITGV